MTLQINYPKKPANTTSQTRMALAQNKFETSHYVDERNYPLNLLGDRDARLEQGVMLRTYVFLFLSCAYHLTCPMIYDTLCLPYLSLTHLSRNPFGSTINPLCTSTPMLTDTCTYPQHATLSPLDSYHSDIPILFLVFLLDDMSYLS